MPQTVRFNIPFSARLCPHRDWADEQNQAWVRASGLIRSEDGFRQYKSWDLADAAARIYPEANRDALADTLNFFTIGFLFDDQFDPAAPGSLSVVAQTAAEMAVIPFRPDNAPVEVDCPITWAWAVLWRRIAAVTSPTWQQRFAAHFAQWLTAHVWETRLTALGRLPDVPAYVRHRRRSVGLDHSYDIAEWTYGFEVPPAAAEHPLLRSLRDAATDAISFMNDIHSYERETSRGEAHNLVMVLRHQRRLSVQEAVSEAARMANEALARFVDLEQQLCAVYDGLRLTGPERDATDRFVQGMRDWIRGNHDWALHSSRYAEFGHHSTPVDDLLRADV